MKTLSSKVSILLVAICLFLQGCSGTPIKVGVGKTFERTNYDMENPRKVSISASGFQLMLFIPIRVNNRHARAYEVLERKARGGLISAHP
jgi:hypothetical protein